MYTPILLKCLEFRTTKWGIFAHPPKSGNKQIISQRIPGTEPVPELFHPC